MLKVLIYTGCFLAVVGLSLYGINKIYQYGWTGGWNTSEKNWREIQVKAQEDKIHAIKTLRDSLRSQAIDMAKAVENLNEKNLEDKQYAELAKDTLIDAIVAGRIKLYYPAGAKARLDNGPDGGRSGNEADLDISPSRCIEETQGELDVATTTFLFREAMRADELAEDYNYLVDYTKLIRATCGEWIGEQE